MIRLLVSSILLFLLSSAALHAAVKTKTIKYRAGGTNMIAYLAYDDAIKGKRPGVLVVPDWWGYGEHARSRVRALAKDGYTAMTVDMYGNGKEVVLPKDASRLSAELRGNLPLMKQRFKAAMARLQAHPMVDKIRIGAIGYSYGGSTVLEMARHGVSLRGVVSYYGDLSTKHPARKGKFKSSVLVLNGAKDPMVPATQVANFKKEMKKAGADFKFINYPNATHLFSRRAANALAKKYNLPLAYDHKVDKKSWDAMIRFFKRIF